MRVATNAYTDSMLNQFNNLASKQFTLQSEVSSGLSVQAPSDNPTAMQETLDLSAQQSANTQYASNISTLQSRSNVIDGVLQSLNTITSRAGEIATLAGGATNSQTDLNSYADEVNKMITQLVSAANTKDPATGQYLFSGTASNNPGVVTMTDSSGDVTGVQYKGNYEVNQVQIGENQTTSVDVPAFNSSPSGARGLFLDAQSGADLFNHLISLRDNLQSGNVSAITQTDAGNIQKDENNIAYQVANNGVLQNQLTAASNLASSRSTTLNTAISNASSTDLVQTMVQLNQAQTAYQAALQSGSKIMSLSLLDYLK